VEVSPVGAGFFLTTGVAGVEELGAGADAGVEELPPPLDADDEPLVELLEEPELAAALLPEPAPIEAVVPALDEPPIATPRDVPVEGVVVEPPCWANGS
jgi:hypothetical protein